MNACIAWNVIMSWAERRHLSSNYWPLFSFHMLIPGRCSLSIVLYCTRRLALA